MYRNDVNSCHSEHPSKIVKAPSKGPSKFVPFSSMTFITSVRPNINVIQLRQTPKVSFSFRRSTGDAKAVQHLQESNMDSINQFEH